MNRTNTNAFLQSSLTPGEPALPGVMTPATKSQRPQSYSKRNLLRSAQKGRTMHNSSGLMMFGRDSLNATHAGDHITNLDLRS